MATLVKVKREKKKSKEKHTSRKDAELPSLVSNLTLEDTQSTSKTTTDTSSNILEVSEENEETCTIVKHTVEEESKETEQTSKNEEQIERLSLAVGATQDSQKDKSIWPDVSQLDTTVISHVETSEAVPISSNLNNVEITSTMCPTTEIQMKISSPEENIQNTSHINDTQEESHSFEYLEQNVLPSAPALEDDVASTPHTIVDQKTVEKVKPKTPCMSLEEAIRVYGGKEIAEVKAMSEREEALVEAGPVSGTEHPLVDLLSTFRSSLIAVERERVQIVSNMVEEEKTRSQLWQVWKRNVTITEKCHCGTAVVFKTTFEQAQLLKEKLPAARMRLEALIRDIQESYCHHQHAAVLTLFQIEDLISEIVKSNKIEIREALSLILQALRLSDGATEVYANALLRWASALSAALVDERDLRQLLFLLHHLFRQTRSVRWAARVVRLNVTDTYSAARAIAVLDLLLAGRGVDSAVECTEDLEAWEEVDVRGGAGAVGEGRLRERDLLALLNVLPLQSLFARLALFPRSDVQAGSALEWGDASGGHGLLKACCGVRATLDVLRRALATHPTYPRLRSRLCELAAKLLHVLAALHLHSRYCELNITCKQAAHKNSPLYAKDLQNKIEVELEACFAAGADVVGNELHTLPASLLGVDCAREYCITLIDGLHDKMPHRIESLRMETAVLSCEQRVRIAAQAAVDRATDHALAVIILEFLFQIGIARKSVSCADACEAAARRELPRLLAAHRALHSAALAKLADIAEPVEASTIKHLSPGAWRPAAGEARAVLAAWAQRCPPLLEHLLLQINCTPHTGISLESQLCIGSWLCGWVSRCGAEPAWCWAALRRLRLHRSEWALPLDAPPPEEPTDLFSTAYALLASAWGHCIPLACGPGAAALRRLAAARPADALHCAAPLMRLMAASPESVSYTPQFTEAFTLVLNAGPSLMQRALGRGGLSGVEMLQQLVLSQFTENRFPSSSSSQLSVWLHALWRAGVPAGARGVLDAAARAARDWPVLDAHVSALMQEEDSQTYVSDAVRHANTAPLLCEAMLRGALAAERLLPHLLDALHQQRARGHRIHVDNALKQLNASITAEDLVVHRTAAALLAAPLAHPAHLALWRLFFHIYLQRPPCSPQDTTPPIGPLFFSGLVKSRVLGQLKKRLQETITYHQKQTELLKTTPKNYKPPERPPRSEKESPVNDSNIFPSLSIVELIGETQTDTNSDVEEEGEETAKADDVTVETGSETNSQDTFNMICYHSAAEKLIGQYARWLDEAEKVRAMPHQADIARFIPEQALDAAWRSSVSTVASPDTPSKPVCPPSNLSTNHTQSHHERAVKTILDVKDTSRRRFQGASIKSPLHIDFNDFRSLLALVDKLLAEIQKLSEDWSSELRYLSKLDEQLWGLVGALRVRRSLPPMSKRCSQGCDPTVARIQEDEWCISIGAERSIQENRYYARTALRRLARARPGAALAAAALARVARGVREAQCALRVAERAGRCADAAAACAPARHALSALVTDLAERWFCHNGALCVELVRGWSRGGPALQALCGVLVCPRRLPPAAWPAVHAALLAGDLPPHAAFSYLSKFEMSRWAETADAHQRRDVLDVLVAAAKRLGSKPNDQSQVLLELLVVHACAVCSAGELRSFACACARASAAGALPPAFCAAATSAARSHANRLPFDELGNIHRELGAVWWEARGGVAAGVSALPARYAPHTAELLRALQPAFVAAARAIGHDPHTVGWYAWCSIHESWGPWITPPPPPPLLPIKNDDNTYTEMLASFVDTINDVILQCPESAETLLRKVWEWCIQTWQGVSSRAAGREAGQAAGRAELAELLLAAARLPWEHQWFHVECLPLALQAASSGDEWVGVFCARTWRGTAAGAWLRGAGHAPAPALAALLALFTSPHLQHSPQTLQEICSLPWKRLPEVALEEALDRFFMDHYNVSVPYHDVPQFIVVLSACELRACEGGAGGVGGVSAGVAGRGRRALGVSRWVRAAAAPALHAHVPAHAARVLDVITALAPHIEQSDGELEELLSRASIIMCMEAAPLALPVWEQWVSGCGSRLRLAAAAAAAALPAPEYFAALADAVARAHLADRESCGWSGLRARWSCGACADAGALATRGRLHAAYGTLLAVRHSRHATRLVFHALASPAIRFEDEPIIALWICVACRIARECAGEGAGSVLGEESRECGAGARVLLTRWGAEPRRSLLQVVALQPATGPTPMHRLLCKLAECILTPNSEATIRAYEAACSSVLGANAGDPLAWGRSAQPRRLPRLATRLYPDSEAYFREELLLAPEIMELTHNT
ncbi:uncharacterized protein Epg5 [Epargyreus clarus]|uniref:uncharacterized protein Epg5 n=1 Tax=Epargyreus clarus TaxID=520877 RepID=UPI003C30C1C4